MSSEDVCAAADGGAPLRNLRMRTCHFSGSLVPFSMFKLVLQTDVLHQFVLVHDPLDVGKDLIA